MAPEVAKAIQEAIYAKTIEREEARKAEEAARAAASTAVRTAVGNAAPCMKMRDEAPFRAHGAPIGTPIRALGPQDHPTI